MSKHAFDETTVIATGVQTFQDRFGKKRPFDDDTPVIAQWRCNLTGLSQVHNLYFVAYGKDIYVYTPEFPTQQIAEQPALIFTSQPSSSGLQGHLDRRNPHCINSLIVQDLGTEEAVAVVRDDGDVDAFLVRHIVQAIDRRAEPDSTIGITGDEIRPFFQSNVGISAWGLAIHTEARILAISSNAHEVRVFKFGLLQADEDVAAPDNGEGSDNDQHHHRKTDITHHVLNGETNIPHIAFCNTGDDPEARWLLTTDISGVCRVMDLHALHAVQAFRFGRSWFSQYSGGFDRLNAGWGIMFLDRRAFWPERDFDAALGAQEGMKVTVAANGDLIWDISDTVKGLEEFGEPFIGQRGQRGPGVADRVESEEARAARQSREATRAMTLEEGLYGPVISSDESDGESDDESDGGAPVDIEIDMGDADQDTSQESDSDVPSERRLAIAREDVERSRRALEAHYHDDIISEESDDETGEGVFSEHMLINDASDPEDEGTEDTLSYTALYSGASIAGNAPRFISPSPLCEGLPCPILHSSVRNIYLLQPSHRHDERQHPRQDLDQSSALTPPLIGLANPLRQTISQCFEHLRLFDRLNMHVSIPSLGLLVLASQKGRAIVLALTKLSPHPPVKGNGGKGVYCMRVEAILPFARQEREGSRPGAGLLGIAASPVQGVGGDKGGWEGEGRWRLLMMFQDQTVLSYELRRSRGGEGVGEVVV
ncbi:uncharacterized protein LTR77_010589 [Saxophila tyrrhenica]|uniref:Uncharacterized protein n=1 Tax=Saxophila tyrrhenica TaxID=1690608 RepID=A0AAV9NWX6_9PEZI|nr:hypothetical protein LTR77_010589 [Saxophila tyrrhenica]